MEHPHAPKSSLKDFCESYAQFPMPRKLNMMWTIGAVLIVLLVMMFVSGLSLALTYTPTSSDAFLSLEEIDRRVPNGWLLHSIHITGASFFFIFLYLHIFRGIFYRSYLAPKKPLWMSGCLLLCCTYVMALSGYILPWSQISYWASSIAGNMLKTIPFVGTLAQQVFWGASEPSTPTLHRMFVMHFTMAFIIIGFVILHVTLRHQKAVIDASLHNENEKDALSFHPYYTIKDLLAITIVFLAFTIVMCFYPDLFIERGAYRPANPLHTPPNINPPWYLLLPFTVLQAIPSKLIGLICAVLSIMLLFALPKLDSCKKPVSKDYLHTLFCALLVLSAILISCAGYHHLKGFWMLTARVNIFLYFAFFLLYLPLSHHFLGKYSRD